VRHYAYNGRLFAYGPYAREIDLWAGLFPNVVIACPCREEEPPPDCLPFEKPNVSLIAQRESGGDSVRAKVRQILQMPVLLLDLARAMHGKDVIHVRCPGNQGLLGVALAPLFSGRFIAKYAGQWNGYPGEPIANRLQRFVLKSLWWRKGAVTVYGEWPKQPRQIVAFFTSMMTERQVQAAARASEQKELSAPVQILYSGRLVPLKRVDLLLSALRLLVQKGAPFRLTVIGDGPQRKRLEQMAVETLPADCAQFIGAVPYDDVMQWYHRAHILVLPSDHSEGWPKVIAEAMCHGVVSVGSAHGLVPWLLNGRGHCFPVGDAAALADVLLRILQDPEQYRRTSSAAASWARRHSIEGLGRALRELMERRWDCKLMPMGEDTPGSLPDLPSTESQRTSKCRM